MLTNIYKTLYRLTLVCTDKKSKFYGCKGFADHWVSDKPDHILFTSIEKVGGSEILSKEQFAVLESSVSLIDRQINELKEQRKLLDTLDINILNDYQ